MKQNWVSYQEIKQRVSMQMVLEHYGLMDRLKASGKNLVGCCPIHHGSNARQFSVSLEKNNFNCFGDCKGGGNVIDFVAKMEKVAIRRAAMLLQNWFLGGNGDNQGSSEKLVSKEAQKTASAFPTTKERLESHDKPINPPLKFALKNLNPYHSFFSERGLLAETIHCFGLGLCSKGMMSGRIAIPIHNEVGQLVAYCGRAVSDEQIKSEGKYRLPPGFEKSAVVFNLHRQSKEVKCLILVESYLSVFRLHQAGYTNTTAIMGSVLSTTQARLLVDFLGPSGRVLLMFDADEDGRKCTADCLTRLGGQLFVKAVDVGRFARKPHRLTDNEIHSLIAT